MLIGWICGTDRFGDNTLLHEMIHKVHKCFDEEYGNVICREVRDKADRKYPEVVVKAAQWTTELILNQFTTFK